MSGSTMIKISSC